MSNILLGIVIGQLIVLQATFAACLFQLRRIGENTYIARVYQGARQ